jgi:hypothetical protein
MENELVLKEDQEQSLIKSEALQTAKWGTGGGIGWLAEYERMAQLVSKSITLPKSYQGDPKSVLAVALTGRELGFGFMQATRSLDLINGQVVLRTEGKLALARMAGHDIQPTCRIEREVVSVKCVKCDSHTVTWMITGLATDLAKDRPDRKDTSRDVYVDAPADLLKKENWQKYPSQMLWARAVGQLVREHCPEVCGGLYSKEEIDQ